MKKMYSSLAIGAFLLASALALQSATASAQAPPSGEPPRMMPRPAEPDADKSKAPLITIDSRQALLGGIYDELAKAKEPEAAKPLIDALGKVWNFSGSATSDVLIERARAAAAEESGVDSSLTFLNAVTELQPEFAQGWYLRAMAYKLKNDSHRALADLRRTLSLDPRHVEALKALAFELNEQGQKKPAREAYEKLLTLYPAAAKTDDPVLQALQRDFGGQEL